MDQRSALQKRIPNPTPQSFVRKEKLAKLAFYFPRGPASFVILEGQDSIATLSVARQVHIHSRVVAVGGASYVRDLHVHLVKFSEGPVPKEHNQVLEPQGQGPVHIRSSNDQVRPLALHRLFLLRKVLDKVGRRKLVHR